MKKILSVVAVMLLAVVMFGCNALAEGVTGEWYGELYGMVMKVTMNEDGSYVMEIAGEAQNGNWVQEGNAVYMDKGTEKESAFVYDEAAQTLTMDEDFVMGRDVIEQWVPAAARVEAALEDFAGVWKAGHVDAFGAVLPVDAAGVYADAVIEGTKLSLTVTFIDAETFEGEAVLEGAALTLTLPASDATKEMTYVATALEDGTLSVSTELFSEPAVFYMEKVSE